MPDEIETKLNELIKQLQDADTEIGTKTKERDILKTDKSALEKTLSDVNQVFNAYSKNYPNNDKDKKDINSYREKKKSMVDAAIPKATRDQIDLKIGDVNAAIALQETDVSNAQKGLQDAKITYQEASTTFETKKKEYEDLKIYQKGLEDDIKNLKNLKQSIELEEEKSHFSIMYFIINELIKNSDFEIKTESEMKSALISGWKEMDAARTDLRKKEDEMKTAQNTLDSKQKTLELLTKSRRDDIINKIKDM
ncbi:MAG: hypothetical protein OIN86_10690 [Candidatus Methanoperedens sp.]|nr:hypothetical protein [Candidatus Methanoperedens sp.]CAG0963835.1 hypothetical protein METP1_00862 [Methanosarcinales archaeon]